MLASHTQTQTDRQTDRDRDRQRQRVLVVFSLVMREANKRANAQSRHVGVLFAGTSSRKHNGEKMKQRKLTDGVPGAGRWGVSLTEP